MSLPPADWVAEAGLAGGEELAPPVPWEDGKQSTLAALLATLGQILASPRRFFASLPLTGGMGEPLGFVLLIGTTGLLGLLIWQALLEGMVAALPERFVATYLSAFEDNQALIFGLVLLTPLYVAISQFFFSFFLFAALRLVGPAGTSFEAVFRVAAYAQAPAILCLVPWVGGAVARLWHLFLLVIGLSQALQFSKGKAVLALVVAVFLLFLVLFFLVLFFGFLGLWRLFWS